MKALFAAVAVSLNILAVPSAALAADKGTADEAVAMVKKAVALIKSDGKEKAYAAFSDRNNTSFHDRDFMSSFMT